MNFRPFNFSDEDYQVWVDVNNTAHPDSLQSLESVKHRVNTLGKDEVFKMFMVEVGERTVGYTRYQTPSNPKPNEFAIALRLLPEYQQHMNVLWEFLEKELNAIKPNRLIANATETWCEYKFYESKGFTVYDRMWTSNLDVTNFDPQPFSIYLEKSKQAGIEVKTLADFPHHEDSFRRTWYALVIELLQNVPSAEPVIPWAYETWLARVVHDPRLLPEGCFFALHNNELIGLSQLWKSESENILQTGLTGVKVAHRRKGIAQTLKVNAALFARDYGAEFIRTNNHQVNRPMLSINEAMGFVKEPANLFLKKELL
ncbi:MAG: GNAT family N-acetyltransferase [Trueperaceae bacterium]